MVYRVDNNTLAARYDGVNNLEIAKLIYPKSPIMRTPISKIEMAALTLVSRLNINRGNWVVVSIIPNKVRILSGEEFFKQYYIPEMNGFILPDSTPPKIAYQYIDDFDVRNLQQILKDFVIRLETREGSPVPGLLLYPNTTNPVPVYSVFLKYTDWLIVTYNSTGNHYIEGMRNTEFQTKYTQWGDSVIPTNFSDTDDDITVLPMPIYAQPFTPSKIYLNLAFHRVQKTTEYAAIQFTSLDFLDVIRTNYPAITFEEHSSVGDRKAYAIFTYGLPSGLIKSGEWMIFEDSQPSNPKFTIVSDEEFANTYRIS